MVGNIEIEFNRFPLFAIPVFICRFLNSHFSPYFFLDLNNEKVDNSMNDELCPRFHPHRIWRGQLFIIYLHFFIALVFFFPTSSYPDTHIKSQGSGNYNYPFHSRLLYGMLRFTKMESCLPIGVLSSTYINLDRHTQCLRNCLQVEIMVIWIKLI